MAPIHFQTTMTYRTITVTEEFPIDFPRSVIVEIHASFVQDDKPSDRFARARAELEARRATQVCSLKDFAAFRVPTDYKFNRDDAHER